MQRSYGFPGWCAICRWTAVGAISVGTMAVLGAATSDHRPAPTVVRLAAQPEGTGLDWPGWTVRDPAEQRRSLDLLLNREKDRRAAVTKAAATSIVSRTAAASASPSAVAVPQSALGHGTTLAAPQAVSVAIRFALDQVGKPYVWGATGPASYDCSGLVQRSYAMAGVALPRTSREQARVGKAVDLPDLLPGDLLFWAYNPADRATVHHVAMYLGDGKIVQAPQPGEFVEVTTMWLSGYAGAVRVATGPATAVLPPVPVGVPGTGITPVGDAMPDGSPPPSPPPPADSPPRIQQRSGASSQSGTTTPDGTPGTSAPGTTTPGTTSPGTTSPGTTSPGTTSPGSTSPGTTSPGSSASGDSGSPTGSDEPGGSASGTGAPATSSAAPDPTTPPAAPTSSAPSSTPPPPPSSTPPPTTPAPPSATPPPPAPSPSGDATGDSAAPATSTSAPPEPSVSPSSPTPSPT